VVSLIATAVELVRWALMARVPALHAAPAGVALQNLPDSRPLGCTTVNDLFVAICFVCFYSFFVAFWGVFFGFLPLFRLGVIGMRFFWDR
jgi:hypothetical protein